MSGYACSSIAKPRANTLSHVETKIYSILGPYMVGSKFPLPVCAAQLSYSPGPLWGVLPSAKRPEGRAARGRPGNVGQRIQCGIYWHTAMF